MTTLLMYAWVFRSVAAMPAAYFVPNKQPNDKLTNLTGFHALPALGALCAT